MKVLGKKFYEKWKRQVSGTTLVELIVSFVVLMILVTATVATLSPALNVFVKVSGMSRAQSVCDILIEKIAGELGASTGNIYISDDGSQIAYDDQTGHQVIMMKKQDTDIHKLLLHYQSVHSSDKTEILEDAVDWYFTDKAYMNNSIQELNFSRVEGTSCIKVHLKLENIRTGYTYDRDKIIECYKVNVDGFKEGESPPLE